MDEDVAADRAGLSRPRGLLAVVPLVFLGVMFVLPVGAVVVTGLRFGGHWDLSGTWSTLREDSVAWTTWFTLWQAAASAFLTLLVALPGAYVLARFEFRGRRLLNSAVLVPFVLPTVVVGAAFL